jgi:hypothetical protein
MEVAEVFAAQGGRTAAVSGDLDVGAATRSVEMNAAFVIE